MNEETQRQAVRIAIGVLTGHLNSKQLTALAGASREIEVANQHYGLNSQVTVNHEAAQLMDSIVGDLPLCCISEIYGKLSKIISHPTL